MTSANLNHDRISPTAKLVAYWRQFSDIPFSADIASLFKVEDVVNEMFKMPVDKSMDDVLVPMVEVRYKCIQNLILKSGIKQVLEFASGISLRGLAMTQDPTLTYVETDLPGLTGEKLSLLNEVMKRNKIAQRSNLFIHPVNILNAAEIEPALKHFKTAEPVIIVHEGLFQYLNMEEKKKAVRNIHRILSRFGGMWVTPDLDTKLDRNQKFFNHDAFKPMMEVIAKATGRNFESNVFNDEVELRKFLDDLDFEGNLTSQLTDDMQISTYKNKTMSTEVKEILSGLRLWVMRPKKQLTVN